MWEDVFYALTDAVGRPIALSITPGQTHDLVGAAELLERIPTPKRLSPNS
jgi:transposase